MIFLEVNGDRQEAGCFCQRKLSFKFRNASVMNLQLDRVCGCHCGGCCRLSARCCLRLRMPRDTDDEGRGVNADVDGEYETD